MIAAGPIADAAFAHARLVFATLVSRAFLFARGKAGDALGVAGRGAVSRPPWRFLNSIVERHRGREAWASQTRKPSLTLSPTEAA